MSTSSSGPATPGSPACVEHAASSSAGMPFSLTRWCCMALLLVAHRANTRHTGASTPASTPMYVRTSSEKSLGPPCGIPGALGGTEECWLGPEVLGRLFSGLDGGGVEVQQERQNWRCCNVGRVRGAAMAAGFEVLQWRQGSRCCNVDR
eukprot:29178-Chlamydomonas_euryale.AAC.1